jgi:hypothetical protein
MNRFLDDLKISATHSTGLNIAAHVLPVVECFPVLGGGSLVYLLDVLFIIIGVIHPAQCLQDQ